MPNLKGILPSRIWRARHDNAVWWWQQQRVKRAIERAFAAPVSLGLDREIVIEGGWPDAADPRAIVFAACDESYFHRFGQHLALSSAARSPSTRVHLHLYTPSSACLAKVNAMVERCGGRLTVSHEGPARDPFGRPMSFYFAAGRFAVASRMRREIAAPILMIDADGLVASDLAAGFAELDLVEAGFILQPDNAALYRKVLASAIYLGTANRGNVEEFFTRLSDGIGLALRQCGHYHVDQIGIHYALRWCESHRAGPSIANLPLKWSDYRFAADSLIWSAKGARKGRYVELLAEVERSF
ncbi:MAG: hypothetical protein LH485_04940 [Sphingomonas bacterium]|nr:hypothetical protein [Sphingomonas bacterium]